MRRLFLLTVVAGLAMAGTAGPALASSHTHHRSSSANVFATWHSRARLGHGQFEVTTWFVGAFTYEGRNTAQVVQDVVKCKRVSGRLRCRPVSFSDGFRRNLSATQFSFDRKHLSAAHLDAAFRLRTFVRGKGEHTSTVTVVVDWTGTGKITRNGGIDSFRSGCLHFHDVFHGKNRKATATGTFGKTALGTTTRAFMSTNSDLSVEHRC
jgi:hypothetical protein